MDDLILVHYCHSDCEPFQNIMRLPREEAFSLAKKLAEANPNTTAFYRFADFEKYYSLRLETDRFLYDNFIRLGGKPQKRHPVSFVLQGSDYLDHWFGNGDSYRIKLDEICSDSVSFSLGDSCSQYEKNGKIQQLTKEQLLARISDFDGGVENFMRYISEHYSYVEVQLWEDIAVYQSKIIKSENMS